MKSIDLDQKLLDKILGILWSFLPDENTNFYIFGSRAKGTAKKFSDIDIAIDLSGKKINNFIKIKLETAFEDSTIPYKVDIIDLNNISEDFKKCIEKDLVKF